MVSICNVFYIERTAARRAGTAARATRAELLTDSYKRSNLRAQKTTPAYGIEPYAGVFIATCRLPQPRRGA
jgi:hypothetical protein